MKANKEWESFKDESSHFAFNVLQQMLMALEEIEVLELSVISLWLHQPTLLNIHHFPEAVWKRSERWTQALSLSVLWDICQYKLILTHVELAYKTRHVVVFEVFGQNFLGKSALVENMKAGPGLELENIEAKELKQSGKHVSDFVTVVKRKMNILMFLLKLFFF